MSGGRKGSGSKAASGASGERRAEGVDAKRVAIHPIHTRLVGGEASGNSINNHQREKRAKERD
ncbi:hypothetical protein PTSG_08884 [Salpingoeca rosetta]|uniref:Uncharacterized protein n=1 Tax=Salpingoeca rosetta (strain ATCC 50818 / BSB-021) TaxID=946362 RepID=F2UKZ5_SALR5|nr:uncharacterized protein PTSG_08884 [Salpingoeca rosetta]EGD77794.1 hypothetical protein PTSG_08884 [Salpingoeca rosetta]|eukprot:XP_004990270.1 hypothetical protein PTSG_08884 [Salpingoeca rosetta]